MDLKNLSDLESKCRSYIDMCLQEQVHTRNLLDEGVLVDEESVNDEFTWFRAFLGVCTVLCPDHVGIVWVDADGRYRVTPVHTELLDLQ